MTLIAYYGARTHIGEESESLAGGAAILDVVNVAALILFDRLERSAIDRETAGGRRRTRPGPGRKPQALTQAYAVQRKLTHDFRACLTTLWGCWNRRTCPPPGPTWRN